MRIARIVAALAFAVGCTPAAHTVASPTTPAVAPATSPAVASATTPPVAPSDTATAVRAGAVPSYGHIVVVVEENHSSSEVVGNAGAPYLTGLAAGGASMTQSHAVGHPSQPNYLALFSGSTQGVTSDSCPHTCSAENLGHRASSRGRPGGDRRGRRCR